MSWVKHILYLFFNDVSKIPTLNQIITAHKAIYKLFSSGVYHSPHSIFKSKSCEYQNCNIVFFNGNDTSMAAYFIEIHRYMWMIKALLATVSSA